MRESFDYDNMNRFIVGAQSFTYDQGTSYLKQANASVPAAIMLKSMIYDRGREIAQHETLAAHLDITVYFADPTRLGSAVRTPTA
jgi:IS30 family transposase